jgi:hypothetical protein
MRIGDREYTREELLARVGNVAQLGGTRHCTLRDGRASGVTAIDVDTGGGLAFTVLPDRGLDISGASYKGLNLVYRTPNGEVHPAYFEPHGSGWLRTFFGGLLTTCGLTYLGPPGNDGQEELGLHGRYTTTPARQVCDRSGWDGDEYRVEISGVVEECVLFGDRIRLTRTISTHLGGRSLVISDVAENFGYRPSPLTVLYHINAGFPLLDASSSLVLTARESRACNEQSARGLEQIRVFAPPSPGTADEDFLHTMAASADGTASAALINRRLSGGLGLFVRFDPRTLPYLNEWKWMASGDYVVAIEPCNAPCENRATLRQQGLLPMLEPGQQREMRVEIGVLEGNDAIDRFIEQTGAT